VEAGYLPVRPSGLESWSETPYFATLQKLMPAAGLVPGNDLVGVIGQPIRDAVVSVLKDQVEPSSAVGALLAKIQAP
jgi:ABC-type glycerol-3-phosphate transport system substrate-binding protein